MQMFRAICICVVCLSLVFSTVAIAGPAQSILRDLATKDRQNRYVNGYLTIGLGVATWAGLYFLGTVAGYVDPSAVAVISLIPSVLIVGLGVASFLSREPAEKEYVSSGGSEETAAAALRSLSRRGYRQRIGAGIGGIVLGVGCLLYPYIFNFGVIDTRLYGLLILSLGIKNIFIQSNYEQAYEDYQFAVR